MTNLTWPTVIIGQDPDQNLSPAWSSVKPVHGFHALPRPNLTNNKIITNTKTNNFYQILMSRAAMKRNLTKTNTLLFWPFFCRQPGRVPSRPLGPMPRGASGGERAALESLLRQMEQQRVGRNLWKSLSTPTSYCTSTFVFLGTKMWTPPPLIRTHPLFLTFSFVWIPPQLASHLFSSQVPRTVSSSKPLGNLTLPLFTISSLKTITAAI